MGLIANYNCISDESLKELKGLGSSKKDLLKPLKSGAMRTSYCSTSIRCGMSFTSCLLV